MQLKTFTAASMPEAMAQVRAALGKDAVILSTHDEEGGGVRLTAAVERDDEASQLAAAPNAFEAIDAIAEALDYHRVPRGLSERLVTLASTLPADDWCLALAGAIDGEFDFTALPAETVRKPIVLLGVNGSGKTSTAAKLCARARLAGCDSSLITMDTEKTGGLAQVTAFAEALGARLDQAADADGLAEALARTPAQHLTVIDTTGISPFEELDMRRLKATFADLDLELVLVLPASSDAMESAETAVAFAEIGATALIPTRLDAARRIGGVLSAAHAGKLALMGAGNAASIGAGLAPLNPVVLARLIVPPHLTAAANAGAPARPMAFDRGMDR